MAQQLDVKERQERSAGSGADRVEVAEAAGRDDRGVQRASRRRGVGWLVVAVVAAVVVAVAVWLAVGSDDGAREVVSNADEAVALQREKSALVAGSQDDGDVVVGADAADKANALRLQDARDSGYDGAAAAEAANAVRAADAGDVEVDGHDGAAAAAAANARVADSHGVAEVNAHEDEALEDLVARGLVPGAAVERDDEVLDDLVARGLVPREALGGD